MAMTQGHVRSCPQGHRVITSSAAAKAFYCSRCDQHYPVVEVITDREGGGSGVCG